MAAFASFLSTWALLGMDVHRLPVLALLGEPGVAAVAVAVRQAGAAGAVQAEAQDHVEHHGGARHRHHRRVLQ